MPIFNKTITYCVARCINTQCRRNKIHLKNHGEEHSNFSFADFHYHCWDYMAEEEPTQYEFDFVREGD